MKCLERWTWHDWPLYKRRSRATFVSHSQDGTRSATASAHSRVAATSLGRKKYSHNVKWTKVAREREMLQSLQTRHFLLRQGCVKSHASWHNLTQPNPHIWKVTLVSLAEFELFRKCKWHLVPSKLTFKYVPTLLHFCTQVLATWLLLPFYPFHCPYSLFLSPSLSISFVHASVRLILSSPLRLAVVSAAPMKTYNADRKRWQPKAD